MFNTQQWVCVCVRATRHQCIDKFSPGWRGFVHFQGCLYNSGSMSMKLTPEGWALWSCRRKHVVSPSWCSILFNSHLFHLSFRPINLEPRPCTTHSTLSGARPWPTMESLTRIWSAKHSGTLNCTPFTLCPEWRGRHKAWKKVMMGKEEQLKGWQKRTGGSKNRGCCIVVQIVKPSEANVWFDLIGKERKGKDEGWKETTGRKSGKEIVCSE